MKATLAANRFTLSPESWADWREILRLWRQVVPEPEQPATSTGGVLYVSTADITLEDAKALK